MWQVGQGGLTKRGNEAQGVEDILQKQNKTVKPKRSSVWIVTVVTVVWQ